MKKTKISMDPERQLVTQMLVSDKFLREIIPVFRSSLLKTDYAREVSNWVIEYWNEYGTSPGKDIQNIYQAKKLNFRDEDEAENIAEFLGRLSRDWDENQITNVDYAVDNAVKYLKTRSLEIINEQLNTALAEGNVLHAEQLISNYMQIAPPTGEGVDLLKNPAKVSSAFIREDNILFQPPGALGRVLGKLKRKDFVSFLGPMKRGKTWWLWYLGETSLYYGLKVLFITLEMSEDEMVRRAWQSLVGSPQESGVVRIPYFEETNNGKWMIKYRESQREKVNTEDIEKIQGVFRRRFRAGGVKIISFPAYSATMDDIEAVVDNVSYYDNFTPDVILIDYADIIAPTRGFKGEYRHQIDDIWKRMRRMAQVRNALVATVSQSDRYAFDSDVTESNIAEDIRKLAHVTCMVGLCQKNEEAEQGIMRLSQIAIREGAKVFDQALVLYDFGIGRAALDSRLKSEVYIPKDDDDDDEEEEKPKKKNNKRGRG